MLRTSRRRQIQRRIRYENLSQEALATVISEPIRQPLSGKAIDFCSLAICSCALTLLCHSFNSLPQSSNASVSQSSLASSTTPVRASTQVSLYTLTSGKPELKDEEQ